MQIGRAQAELTKSLSRQASHTPHIVLVQRPDVTGEATDASPHHFGDKAHARMLRLKRALDLTLTIPALVFLAPAMLLIALAIRLQDGGPALFRHNRIGKSGAEFACLKFRTMVLDADARLAMVLASDPNAAVEWAKDQKLRNDPRITWLGRFLRKTSLDELPQLINVVRGEMSLVGPRPIVQAEIAKYGERFADYCAVRPGITGLWQVSGRNDTTYEERVALDSRYARSVSARNDVSIILRTVPALLGKGAY